MRDGTRAILLVPVVVCWSDVFYVYHKVIGWHVAVLLVVIDATSFSFSGKGNVSSLLEANCLNTRTYSELAPSLFKYALHFQT
jgi:hypothetical protein